jgi:5'(3')-deoxyribonucleotidase
MKKIKMLLDMDGTICNFTGAVKREVLALGYGFGDNVVWAIEDAIEGCDHPKALVSEICGNVDFWSTLEPYPYAYEILKELNKEVDITVCTNPWKDEKAFKQAKIDYIRDHYGFLRKNPIIFTDEKEKVDGDVIFDDKPKTLEKCKEVMITVKPVRTWNVDTEADFSFNSWKEVPKIMKTIEKFFKENSGQD